MLKSWYNKGMNKKIGYFAALAGHLFAGSFFVAFLYTIPGAIIEALSHALGFSYPFWWVALAIYVGFIFFGNTEYKFSNGRKEVFRFFTGTRRL